MDFERSSAPFGAGVSTLGGVRAGLRRLGLVLLAACALAAGAQSLPTRVSSQSVVLPAVSLQGSDGIERPLSRALDDGRPTVVTFMYSSCATVCPITNQTLVQFEQLLGAERPKVNTVSISIDPTYDTVQRLADYARRTRASGAYFTGDPEASEAVQRAFNVWRGGEKMNHQPVFLLRPHGRAPWTRVDGLVSPKELLAVYRGLSRSAESRAELR